MTGRSSTRSPPYDPAREVFTAHPIDPVRYPALCSIRRTLAQPLTSCDCKGCVLLACHVLGETLCHRGLATENLLRRVCTHTRSLARNLLSTHPGRQSPQRSTGPPSRIDGSADGGWHLQLQRWRLQGLEITALSGNSAALSNAGCIAATEKRNSSQVSLPRSLPTLETTP